MFGKKKIAKIAELEDDIDYLNGLIQRLQSTCAAKHADYRLLLSKNKRLREENNALYERIFRAKDILSGGK